MIRLLCGNFWAGTWFFVFLGSIAFAQQGNVNKREIKRLLKRADKFYQAENYHRALETYERILHSDPAHPAALYRAGINQLHISGSSKALAYLEKYGNQQKKLDKHYHYWLGRAYHLSMEFDLAAQSYDRHSSEISKHDIRQEELRRLKQQTQYGKTFLENQDYEYYAISLGAPLNSSYSDHSPILTTDRQTLIFTSRRTENRRGEEITPRGDAFENIYISRFVNGSWDKPILADKSLYNRRQHTSNVQLFDNGNKMLIYKSVGYGSLFVTERQDDGWSRPRKYNKYLSTAQFEPNGFVVENQSVVYFSSGRDSKDGNLDLFVSRRNSDSTWSAPERLPDMINTDADEDAPVLSGDGFTLYFCSRGHDTMGGYDVFRTTFDPSSGSWLKPINLGYPINSPADDIYFIPDSLNQTSYLASNRIGTVGQEDIFVVKLHEKVLVKGMVTDIRTGKPLAGFSMSTVAQRKPERQAGLTIAEDGTYDFQLMSNYSYNVQIKNEEGEIILQDVLEVPPAYESHTQLIKDYQLKVSSEELAVQKQWLRIENRNLLKIKYMPTDSIFFAGKVSSIAGNIPEARVLIRKEESGDILYETTTNDQGNYIFGFIPESKTDYIIEIHKAGYLPNHIAILYTDELDTRGSGLDSASYSLNAIDVITKLIEVKAGARQVIGGVYFEFKSADLFPESFIVLDQLADYLQADPDITIEVGGFTDDAGTEQENKLLSLRRAQSVIHYLRSKGIPAQKLKAAGYSKNNPIVSNASAINGRDVNRRVEIKILSR